MGEDKEFLEGKKQSGRNAQRMNIYASKLVAETVRTTLGPKGMDKMLVDEEGNVIVTNDGVTILKEIQIDHPVAKMIVEIAKTQEEEVGDGTTTAVILAGELLKQAETLLDRKVHPTIVTKGYYLASEKAQEILKRLSHKINVNDESIIKKIGETAMTGKGAEDNKELLAKILYESIKKVTVNKEINKEDIKIEKRDGGFVKDTELVNGILLDKDKVHSSMPNNVENAVIALIDTPLEIRTPDSDTRINITSPEQIQGFMDVEEAMVKKMIDKIAESGANVVFCQKGIDEMAQHFLNKKGILAVRRIKKSDMERLSKATNATIVTDINSITSSDLGRAGKVNVKRVHEDNMIYVQDCPNPRSISILVRGATKHTVDEVARAMEDALGDMVATLKTGTIVPGAGAIEVMISKELNEYANTLKGREQLAVQAFSESLLIVPKTLAENAGLDPIDVMTALTSSKEKNAGINVFNGMVIDSKKEGVIEPTKIKSQAISSASEVAMMILRIDDVILSKEINTRE